MPIDAVALRDQLRGAGFRDPNVALAFGDVLAAHNRRGGLVRWGYRLISLVAALSPGRRAAGAQTAGIVLVAAGHDLRSVDRLRPLETALRLSGLSVDLWCIGRDEDLPGFDLAGVRRCPAISPLQALRATRGVMRTGRAEATVSERLEILRWVLVQAARTKYYSRVLTASGTALVVSDFDRGLAGAPVVLAARRLGIRTHTLLHGDPNKIGYTPFVAESVSTWNSAQRQTLVRWDPEARLLQPVGAHWVEDLGSLSGESDSAHVLFAHSGDGGFTTFVQNMSELAKRHQRGGAVVRFRPHPLVPEEETRIVSRDWPVSSEKAATALAWADVVYCEQSTFAFDAVTAGCTVRIRGGDGLASIEGLPAGSLKTLPDDWLELPPRRDDWPHQLVGEAALDGLLDQINGRLPSSGPQARAD